MKYRVEGAHRETGEFVSMELNAPDEATAEARAASMGVLTSGVIAAGVSAASFQNVRLDSDSLGTLTAEVRALRQDVRDATEATLRFTRTPISKISWGVFVGMLLCWLVPIAIFLLLMVLGLVGGGLMSFA